MSDEVSNLKPAQYNPRKISNQQLTRLRKAMKTFGDLGGIVKNIRTGNLIGGHQRVKIFDPSWPITATDHSDEVGTVAIGYIDTPWGKWSYREVDWDLKKEMAANVAANRHGGDWDIPKLKDVLTELNDGSFDFELTGFSEGELKDLIDWEGLQKEKEKSTGAGKKSVTCPSCGHEFEEE